jgi:hypothetical protein
MPKAQESQSFRHRLLGRVPPGIAVAAGLALAVIVMFAAGVSLPSSAEVLAACQANCAPRAGRMVSTLPEAMVAQGKQAPKKCECH